MELDWLADAVRGKSDRIANLKRQHKQLVEDIFHALFPNKPVGSTIIPSMLADEVDRRMARIAKLERQLAALKSKEHTWYGRFNMLPPKDGTDVLSTLIDRDKQRLSDLRTTPKETTKPNG